MVNFEYRQNYSWDDLLKIVELLRAPGGCPWDRAQTHKSIRDNLLEESCEAIEAIDKDDMELLCEELGDVLLQVFLHSRIAEEENAFTLDSVVDGIAKKLIFRHPHVFSGVAAENADAALTRWDEIKRAAKGHQTQADSMRAVSKGLPGFMRAEKLLRRAEKTNLSKTLSKIEENDNKVLTNDELGDMLFTTTVLARKQGLDPDAALNGACDRFIAEFEKLEKIEFEK